MAFSHCPPDAMDILHADPTYTIGTWKYSNDSIFTAKTDTGGVRKEI